MKPAPAARKRAVAAVVREMAALGYRSFKAPTVRICLRDIAAGRCCLGDGMRRAGWCRVRRLSVTGAALAKDAAAPEAPEGAGP